MTPLEVIAQADAIAPNPMAMWEKVNAVARAEDMVQSWLQMYHIKGPWPPIVASEPLKVKSPWDTLYVHYVLFQIHYTLGDMDRANLEMSMFRTAFENWRNHYNATHLAKAARLTYF